MISFKEEGKRQKGLIERGKIFQNRGGDVLNDSEKLIGGNIRHHPIRMDLLAQVPYLVCTLMSEI